MSTTELTLTFPPVVRSEREWDRWYSEHARAGVVYVVAESVELMYGGPEEGGWWYDASEPVAAIPVRTFEQARNAMRQLHDTFAPQYGPNDRWNVHGGPDLCLGVSGKWPVPEPAERPRYQ